MEQIKNIEYKSKPFTDQYKSDILNWVNFLEKPNKIILAISRKGPRLIELLFNNNLVSSSVLNRTITEYAIPFTNKSDKISIIDDSVLYGSTLNDIILMVREHFNMDIDDIDVAPFKYSYEAPEEVKNKINKLYSSSISSENYSEYIGNLISNFKSLGKPYDIEHPILYLNGDFSDLEFVKLKLKTISNNIPNAAFTENVNFNFPNSYTILLSGDNDRESDLYEFTKIRIFIHENLKQITFVPIAPCIISNQQLSIFKSFLPEKYVHIWDKITNSIHINCNNNHLKTLIILANYLNSLSFFKKLLPFFGKYFNVSDFLIKSYDLQLLVGFELSEILKKQFTEYLYDDSELINFNGSHLNYLRTKESFIPKSYEKEYYNYYYSRLDHLKSINSESEVINHIFYSQHLKIELPSREGKNYNSQSRLQFGLTLKCIIELVKHTIHNYSITNIHAAIDKLIDCGAIVPKYAILSGNESDDPTWGRIFRVGEGLLSTTQKVLMIIKLFNNLKDKYLTDEVPATVLEKYSVIALTNLFNFSELQEYGIIELGIIKKYSLYGARSFIILDADGTGDYYLDWAEKLGVLRRNKDDKYLLNQDVVNGYLLDECAISSSADYKLNDIGRFCYHIHSKISETPLITITTLASKKDYWLAISAELHLWLNHPQYNIYNCIHKLEEIRNNINNVVTTKANLLSECNTLLFNNANYTAQVRIKKNLFNNFNTSISHLDSFIISINDELTARVWKTIKNELKQSKEKYDSEYGSKEILSILRICHLVTSVCRTLLNRAGLPIADKVKAPKTLVQYLLDILNHLNIKDSTVDEYNYLICQYFEKNDVPNQLRNILLDFKENASFVNLFDSIKPLLIKTADISYSIYYNFGFPPTEKQVIKILPPPIYILMWDIRNSNAITNKTQLEQTVLIPIRKEIRNMLNLEEELILKLDDGGNILTKSFHDVISAFEIICRYSNESKATFRIGCDVNFEGDLHLITNINQIGGRAFEYADRTLKFFKETNDSPQRWTGDKLLEPEKTYLIVSEFAKRIAIANDQWDINDNLLNEPNGEYRPRVPLGTVIPYKLSFLTQNRQE